MVGGGVNGRTLEAGASHVDEEGNLHIDKKAATKALTAAGISLAKQHDFDVGDTSVDADTGKVHIDTKTIGESALGLAEKNGVDIGETRMDADGNLRIDPKAAGERLLTQPHAHLRPPPPTVSNS